jgi:hypothetical protein
MLLGGFMVDCVSKISVSQPQRWVNRTPPTWGMIFVLS